MTHCPERPSLHVSAASVSTPASFADLDRGTGLSAGRRPSDDAPAWRFSTNPTPDRSAVPIRATSRFLAARTLAARSSSSSVGCVVEVKPQACTTVMASTPMYPLSEGSLGPEYLSALRLILNG